MEVRIVEFTETRVAVAEHRGPPGLEHETSRRLIEWRIQNRLSPAEHRTYGVHYTDPYTTPAADHRVDFCVTYDQPVQPNSQGIISKMIPANRCALARHLGSRAHNSVAVYLYKEWLPQSGQSLGNFPIFFHYVNVGPNVQEHEMITDVYLPLRSTARGTAA
jgi:AraC family transcriptional regulator